jgi:hypothetical protein
VKKSFFFILYNQALTKPLPQGRKTIPLFRSLCISEVFRPNFFTEIKYFLKDRSGRPELVRYSMQAALAARRILHILTSLTLWKRNAFVIRKSGQNIVRRNIFGTKILAS